MTAPSFIVRCADCNWQGPSSQLASAAGLRYCPKCGQEFSQVPAASPQQWNLPAS